MKYHIIDSDNYAASGIETMFFPGGEPHAKVPRFDKPVLFFAKLRTWNDVGVAACVANGLSDHKVFIPYLPGARQDKDHPFTIDLVTRLFGDQHYLDVSVFDVHSNKLYNWQNWQNWMPSDLPIRFEGEYPKAIVAPDEGAALRATDFRNNFFPKAAMILCTKERDPTTGRLFNYRFPEGHLRRGRYIVVDDICDGGGTFNLLAKAFKEKIAYYDGHSLELFVSHGIFSKTVANLYLMYSHIYTTDSWYLHGAMNRRVTVFPLSPLFDKIMAEYL